MKKLKKKYEKPKAIIVQLDNEISVLMISPPTDPPKAPKKSGYFGDNRDEYIHWA
jgi:hypothetical protein